MSVFLSLLSFVALAAWVYLAFAQGRFWMPLLPPAAPAPAAWPSVDIVVPARNEADSLPRALPSLLAQDYPGDWRIILIDDHSDDGTAQLARQIAETAGKADKLTVAAAPDLPPGWTGKVAAMHAGVTASRAEMILFTDADILHAPSSLRHLAARAQSGGYDLTSRMVMLNCQSVAEKLLIPAFVFFFAMLYPFRRANDPASTVAAAAGGTMLIRRAMLDKIGGMGCIKNAIIDDCSLARAVKDAQGRIELTLTREIESLRPYPHIRDVWHMVARTAYTQLRYSPLLLAGTLAGMTVLYLLPPLFFWLGPSAAATGCGLTAYLLMSALYLPVTRFYGLPFAWALTLPLSGLVYGLATADSARLFHLGKGGQWKGRAQAEIP